MTRLVKQDIESIDRNLKHLEQQLRAATGCSLLEIGAFAMGQGLPLMPQKVAVVPITTGLGIIDGFSETVKEILLHLGADAFVTQTTDIGGLQEAFDHDAAIVFMADDATFSAFHLRKRIYSDNGTATGRGFAAALYLAAEQKIDREVLVLGAGPVGQAAMAFLLEKNVPVALADCDNEKAEKCQTKYPDIRLAADWAAAQYQYILEATPVADLIETRNVTNKTIISAPGVPLGVAPAAAEKADRTIHNLLELGVATMLCAVS
jgi:pyrrolysine biosynthesis protein PylD